MKGEQKMFENLKAEMARKNLTIKDLSKDKDLGLSYETLRNKFLSKTEWSRDEMWTIRAKYFPEKSIEYLFEQNSQPNT